ncbi:ABC transporter permease [Desulfogranum marinum]|uniref:ABC transporter permease n=1 Tax=Desulfogranum marinum TaxID=453220 RepID=UPI0019634504|nr:FtsX-like permease family protein [Desulfogranum marinum]MBM9512078.1 ABC transporter permease [Desulfogranum marinum]
MGDMILAWRNVWRNPRRSLLTILAIVFAAVLLVFMLSFQFGSYEDMINATVRQSTGHLQVQSPGYHDRQEMHLVVADAQHLVAEIEPINGVSNVALRSEAFALMSGEKRSRGTTIFGIQPEKEKKVTTLPRQIKQGRYLQKGDHGVALIGSLLAKRLQLTIGDECTMLGQGKDGSIAAALFTIIGIYTTGVDAVDRATVHITFADFNHIFFMEKAAHRVIITAEHLADITPITQALQSNPAFRSLTILTWDKLAPGLRQSMELDLISGIIMYIILVVVVAFSVLNTFFMAFFERTREFGVLLSIGARPARLVRMILTESMLLTFTGIALGTLIGIGLTVYFSHQGISFGDGGELLAQYGFEDRFYPRLSWMSACLGPALLLIITFFTALIPALKVPDLKPVDALRSC